MAGEAVKGRSFLVMSYNFQGKSGSAGLHQDTMTSYNLVITLLSFFSHSHSLSHSLFL